ncbi:hypothetical protein BC937DRAFT_92723 [Endogone sp. FLAS-F59071]|nr:hypothetical protein BC937DRAFT_92723 [Endogone sp. FLAS-F59071]|eukprot:RUS15228.1 hypothetical protein BC937DRAFT_92723 [Endogone sp. FLAS-F59071]
MLGVMLMAEKLSILRLGNPLKGEDPKSTIPLAFSLDPSTGQFSVLSYFPSLCDRFRSVFLLIPAQLTPAFLTSSTAAATGLWTIHQLHLTSTLGHGTRVTLTESLTLPLQGFAFGTADTADTKRGAVAVAPIKDGYLALVGARRRGSSDKLDHVLTIWDIRYGTLQAERTISAVTVGDEVDGAWVVGCTYSVSYSLLILPPYSHPSIHAYSNSELAPRPRTYDSDSKHEAIGCCHGTDGAVIVSILLPARIVVRSGGENEQNRGQWRKKRNRDREERDGGCGEKFAGRVVVLVSLFVVVLGLIYFPTLFY